MKSIKHYIANAHGQFDDEMLEKIKSGFKDGSKLITDYLGANNIDVVFVNDPFSIIPEQGIGGYAPGPYNIYVSLDPKNKSFTRENVLLTMLHEAHHCMRWRKPGYGNTLGEVMISEGLATLCEAEYSGVVPIYGRVKIKEKEIKKALVSLDKDYIHKDWFFGSKDIQRWFAYTYGYHLCKEYSEKSGKNAVQLMHEDAKVFYAQN